MATCTGTCHLACILSAEVCQPGLVLKILQMFPVELTGSVEQEVTTRSVATKGIDARCRSSRPYSVERKRRLNVIPPATLVTHNITASDIRC